MEPTLAETIEALVEAIAKVDSDPTFENATEACLASRVAWGFFFSDWKFAGSCPDQLTERLRSSLQQCKSTVEEAAKHVGATDADRIRQYVDSIGFRSELLDLLLTTGADAVKYAVDTKLATPTVQVWGWLGI